MSERTTVLGKLRLFEGVQGRFDMPRLSSVHVRVRKLSLIGGRDWAVPAGARSFQREQLALQGRNESISRPTVIR